MVNGLLVRAGATAMVLLAGLGLGGCAPARSGGDCCQRLQSDNPADRVQAIIEAGQNKDLQAVPLLVDRLEDDDSDVRMFAILSLERITGRTFGYRYYQSEPVRRESVDRWRDWLEVSSQPSTQTAVGGQD